MDPTETPINHLADLWLSGQEAKLYVRGAMACSTYADLRAEVQAVLDPSHRLIMDLTEHQAARLATALLKGYAYSHPAATLTAGELSAIQAIGRALVDTTRRLAQVYVAAFRNPQLQAALRKLAAAAELGPDDVTLAR